MPTWKLNTMIMTIVINTRDHFIMSITLVIIIPAMNYLDSTGP